MLGSNHARPRPRTGLFSRTSLLGSLLLACALLGAAAAQGGVTLGPSATIDAELHGVPVEPETRQALGRVEAHTPERDVIATLQLSLDDERVMLRGELPDLAGSRLLEPITSETLWPCPVEVSDPAARFLPINLHAEGLGSLQLGTDPPSAEPLPGEISLVLVYADAAVAVQATCREDGPEMTLVVDAALRPGWNLLASELQHDAEDEQVLLRKATPEELAQARWYARALPRPAAPERQQVRPGDGD